ncbi:MAG: ribosome small subunit-dependent GTPase A [Candidatus Aminicenantes bacterium]|jgi:ribosome biogenesis GTPase
MELKDLGFDDWFKKQFEESEYHKSSVARVSTVNKNNYLIRNENTEIPAEITGKLMYGAEENLDLPVVGDWVSVEYFNENTLAIINNILPRKSLLKRKVAGRDIEYQPIASNIDIAFIVQSVEFDFNLRRLERYLIMIHEGRIAPFILLSKTDLIPKKKLEQEIAAIEGINPDCDIIAFSNKTCDGLENIQNTLKPGKTACLLGSSGVGKTTLINRLIGEDLFATDTIREKDGKGRHITARRQLIILEQGGLIIDTPGMRELGNIGVSAGIEGTFGDIIELAENCRFKDCTHTEEPGCSVIDAVKSGELSEKRYQNYLKVRKESEFYEMSYLERRRKEKSFGKMCRTVKDHDKRKI